MKASYQCSSLLQCFSIFCSNGRIILGGISIIRRATRGLSTISWDIPIRFWKPTIFTYQIWNIMKNEWLFELMSVLSKLQRWYLYLFSFLTLNIFKNSDINFSRKKRKNSCISFLEMEICHKTKLDVGIYYESTFRGFHYFERLISDIMSVINQQTCHWKIYLFIILRIFE